jgi:hypothetical protein
LPPSFACIVASSPVSDHRSVHATTVRDRTRLILALLAGSVGLVWLLQGLGAPIGGSFMVGNMFWAYAGGALILAAFVVAAWPRLRHR